jgi:hypothetical protein
VRNKNWKYLMRFLYAVLLAIASPGVHVCTCVGKTFYVLSPFLNCYYDQDQQLSEDEELPLGVEAAINEDAFDLEDLEEDELIQDGAASQASLASSAFLSAIQEVKILIGLYTFVVTTKIFFGLFRIFVKKLEWAYLIDCS